MDAEEHRRLRAFLDDLRRQLNSRTILFEDRPANKQTLLNLGLRASDRKDYLMALKEQDYSEGPFKDDFRVGWSYYVFGIWIKGVEVYIKITRQNSLNDAVCISFHEARHAMNYPLKNNTQ